MQKKFYLFFKAESNGFFSFENIMITDGHYIINDGKKDYADPFFKKKNNQLFSDEIISFDSEAFTKLLSGGKSCQSFSRSSNYKADAENLYLSVLEEKYNSFIKNLCQEKSCEFNDAQRIFLTYLYKIGDSITYIYLNKNNSEFSFKNQGDYGKVTARTEEFICKELNIPYKAKKEVSVNENSSNKKVVPPQTKVTKKSITEEDRQKALEEIKKDVIAQDEVVDTVLNVIYYNQIVIDEEDEKTIAASKDNILIDGPTGTGKTLIVKEVARNLSLPIVKRPVTSFSTTGYKGADLNDLLIELLNQTGGDLELAERGIIVLDEFDKLCATSDRDLVMKQALQQELLSYISGDKFDIEYNGKRIVFDTSKITFVALGAFTDLRNRKISENEKKYKQGLGFNAYNEEEYSKFYTIDQNDFVEEGLMRELVGRFNVHTCTQELTKEMLEDIINNSELSPLKAFIRVGKNARINKRIVVDDDVVSEIAEIAYDEKFGARGLTKICSDIKVVMLNDLFSKGINEIVINKDILEKARKKNVRRY